MCWFAFQRAVTVGATVLPVQGGRFVRPSPHSPYTYTASGASPVQSASPKRVPLGYGPDRDRAVHPRELGKRRMRSSLPSGKSATPPARCIHRPQRDTSSAEYLLLVSLASVGASRELSSRRSPAHPSSDRLRGSLRSGDTSPHTCAVCPTFRYGAFLFVAFALPDLSSARLTTCNRNTTRKQASYNGSVVAVANCSENDTAMIWRKYLEIFALYLARLEVYLATTTNQTLKRTEHAERNCCHPAFNRY